MADSVNNKMRELQHKYEVCNWNNYYYNEDWFKSLTSKF